MERGLGSGQEGKSERGNDDGNGNELTIDENIAIAMGLFDVDLLTAKRMTPYEYKLRILAFNVKRQKQIELTAIQAWLNNQAKATKKVGAGKFTKYKNVFKNFREFYDSEKEFATIFNNSEDREKQAKKMSVAEMNRIINKNKGG